MVTRHCAAALWLLSFLFAVRVGGQAAQYWFPQAYLPAFHSFQGSKLPYWSLLGSQLVILGIMLRVSWRVGIGAANPRPSLGKYLAWLGAIYFVLSAARLAIGYAEPNAPEWFRAWIPGAFHVVLALFVIVLAGYHLHGRPLKVRL